MPLSLSFSLSSQCMCSAENPACRDKPFTVLYRHMDLTSGRGVPADIFQMQATTRYPGAFYIFQIKSGNEGREFTMRVSDKALLVVAPRLSLCGGMRILRFLCDVNLNILHDYSLGFALLSL